MTEFKKSKGIFYDMLHVAAGNDKTIDNIHQCAIESFLGHPNAGDGKPKKFYMAETGWTDTSNKESMRILQQKIKDGK